MAYAYNVKSTAATINVTNTAVAVTPNISLPNVTTNVGDTIRITLYGQLTQPGYSLDIRVGANGGVGDAVVWSSNNTVQPSTLFNDANTWAQSNPGLNGTDYFYNPPFQANTFPAVRVPPQWCSGEIFLSVNSITTNTVNASVFVEPKIYFGPNNLLSLLAGNQGYASWSWNTAGFLMTVTSAVPPANTLVYSGVGQGNVSTPMGASFNVAVSPNVPATNSVFSFGMIEVL